MASHLMKALEKVSRAFSSVSATTPICNGDPAADTASHPPHTRFMVLGATTPVWVPS